MLCPQCQTENADGSKFCIRCGTLLTPNPATPNTAPMTNINSSPQPTSQANPTPAINPTINTSSAPDANPTSTKMPNFFAVIIAIFLKPITTLKEELPKFSSIKSASIITAISVIASTLFSLITTILTTARNVSRGLFSGETTVTWDFDFLEDFDFFKFIGQSFLTNVVIILLIAAVFFGISRAFRQNQTNFWRILSIVALASLPLILATFLAPLAGFLYGPLSMFITVIGLVYSLCIFYEGIGQEVALSGDKKVYFSLLAIVTLMIIAFICVRAFLGDSSSSYFNFDFSDYLDLF